MKNFSALLLCGTMVLASGSLAAQDDGHDQYHGDQNHGDKHDNHDHGNRDHDRGDHGDRHDDRRDDQRRPGMYDRGRHEGWYRRGGRMPLDYRGDNYVVSDWRGNRLREPPRGYSWVRSDNGDFLLIALSTGIIESILSH